MPKQSKISTPRLKSAKARRELIKKAAGAVKGWADDPIWKEILDRRSTTKPPVELG